MDYEQSPKAFLKNLPQKQMSGHQKFLAMAALQSKGKEAAEISVGDIKKGWRKSLLGLKYNSAFYDRAQRESWVKPAQGKKGVFSVTRDGFDHLSALTPVENDLGTGGLKQSGGLIIVNRKATHTFDKFLRRILAEAKNHVLIADSWVDASIFDNVLDVIPKTVTVKLVYAKAYDNFEQRVKRFSTEYSKFAVRRYKHLHDRFLVVDDSGYIIGPSIKDAASHSPALVMMLGGKEKRLLQGFFEELWKKGVVGPQR